MVVLVYLEAGLLLGHALQVLGRHLLLPLLGDEGLEHNVRQGGQALGIRSHPGSGLGSRLPSVEFSG